MGKSFIIIILCCFAFSLNAQDSLCVFNVKGSVYRKLTNTLKPLTKGMFISKKSTLLVSDSAEITTINSEGRAFQINEAGEYKYKSILEHNTLKNAKGLTSKYFKLIWNELIKNNSGKTIIGGVFRGDVIMESPIDSTKTASSKLTFKWKVDEELSQCYLFIKNTETEDVLKLATNGSELSLYKNNAIFSEGSEFQWTVSKDEFPNLKNIPFYTFTLIDRIQYEDFKSNYEDLINDLKTLGLSNFEIVNSLCETYGICK